MCHDPRSLPPQPPLTGHLNSSDRLTIEASDGTTIASRLATANAPSAPGVVILPDVRGLHPYYEHLADAFAGAGIHALAIDLYSRPAGTGYRDAGFDWQQHRPALTDATLLMDADAAVTRLKQSAPERIYLLGFCAGGRGAFLRAVGRISRVSSGSTAGRRRTATADHP